MDKDFTEWLSHMSIEDLMWVVEMANAGVRATEGAGNHPANVFLYDLECHCKELIEKNQEK